MKGTDAFLTVQRCFLGPNPYSTSPVLEILWNDEFLSRPQLLAGMGPMAAASSRWIDATQLTENASTDRRSSVASWLTNWSFLFLNSTRGHLKSYGTVRDGDKIVSWICYHNAGLAFRVMVSAAHFLASCGNGVKREPNSAKYLDRLLEECRLFHPDFQAKHLMEAADALDIPYFPAKGIDKSWQYGWGCNSVLSRETGLAENSFLFHQVARNKLSTKHVLRSLGLPVGKECLAHSREQLQSAIGEVGFPCATKPIDGKKSRNVTIDIRSQEELLKSFNLRKNIMVARSS